MVPDFIKNEEQIDPFCTLVDEVHLKAFLLKCVDDVRDDFFPSTVRHRK
jgi:hypothetical protein